MQQLLVIGTVWPEPNSTAAGQYMMNLLSYFRRQEYDITFASSATKSVHSADLTQLSIKSQQISLNCSSFDDFIAQLQPDVVLFDRFMSEEQFAWRVQKYCPDAIRILDLEDLHGLRHARQQAFKEKRPVQRSDYLNDVCLREIAAIWRSDLALVISRAELALLKNQFSMPLAKCFYLPFMCQPQQLIASQEMPLYSQRQHFISIGHFRHAPNWDSVLFLKQHIWPKIRQRLPQVELHIYGAYPAKKVTQLDCHKSGFRVKGWTPDAFSVIRQAKVMLAPLRFGAGLKGKLFDAMRCATPFVTTRLGAEGLLEQKEAGYHSLVADDVEEIVNKAVELYQNEQLWQASQKYLYQTLATDFMQPPHEDRLTECLQNLQRSLDEHRGNNFIGAMLMHHSMKSTQYMAQWIEAKNRLPK